MATFGEVKKKIAEFHTKLVDKAPVIIAETATEYFKGRFTEKEFDGNPWEPTKREVRRGSLMVRSGALAASVRPSFVSTDQVRISAGGDKVPYARIHNEGGTINHPGGTAWTMVPEAKGSKVLKPVWVTNKKAQETGKKYPRTPPHAITIPQRQFMGDSRELNDMILRNLNKLIQDLT